MFSSVVSSDDAPTEPEPPKAPAPPPDPSKDLGGMAEYLQQIMPPSFQTQAAPVQTSDDMFTEDDLTEALGGASATSMLLASELSAKKSEAAPAVVDKRPKRSFSLASFPGLDAEKPPDDKPVDFKQLVFNYRRKQWQNRELYEREENFDVDLARLNEASNDMQLEAGFVRKALMEEKKNTWDLRKFNYEYESDDEFEFDDDKEIDRLIETVIAQAENVPEIPDPDAPPEPAPPVSRKPSMAPGAAASLAAMLPRATSVSGSQSARYAPSRMQDLPPVEEVKKLPSSVKVFIFDLCGTLVDDRVKLFHDMIPLVCVAFVSALKSSGIHIFPEDAMKHAGKYVHTALDGLLREHGPFIKNENEAKSFAEDVLNNFVKALQRHTKEITQEIPGATETLQLLKSRGYRLALSCETPRSVIEHCLTTFGWTDLFDCITYSEKVQGGKPSPVQILDAMNQLGVYDAKQVIKVGDTKFDLQEAKSAGVQSVAVLSGVLSQKAVSKLKPDFVVGSIKDIPQLLP